MTQEEALKKFDEATGWLTNNPIDVLHRARAEFVEYINKLESRTCESCKFYDTEYGVPFCKNKELVKKLAQVNSSDELFLIFNDFSCNRWEQK